MPRPPRPFTDEARFFRSPALPDAELLAARFFRHAYAPHWHEGFVVAIITAGAEGYDYRGERHEQALRNARRSVGPGPRLVATVGHHFTP